MPEKLFKEVLSDDSETIIQLLGRVSGAVFMMNGTNVAPALLTDAMRAKLVHARAVLEALRQRLDSGLTATEWQKGYVKALEEIFDLEEVLPGILFLVARDKLALYEYLLEQAARQAGMEVILDRRREERRQRIQVHVPERRRADRRRQSVSEDDLRSHGFVVIR